LAGEIEDFDKTGWTDLPDVIGNAPVFAFMVNGEQEAARALCARLVRFLGTDRLSERLDQLGVPR
jgi:hypothetical protein